MMKLGISFSRALMKSVYLVLSLSRNNLFVLNHLKTLFSSNLAVWKSYFMFLCEKKRFAPSANIMGSNILDTLQKSFTYIMKRSSPQTDPWSTLQIISRLDLFHGTCVYKLFSNWKVARKPFNAIFYAV